MEKPESTGNSNNCQMENLEEPVITGTIDQEKPVSTTPAIVEKPESTSNSIVEKPVITGYSIVEKVEKPPLEKLENLQIEFRNLPLQVKRYRFRDEGNITRLDSTPLSIGKYREITQVEMIFDIFPLILLLPIEWDFCINSGGDRWGWVDIYPHLI